MTKQQILTEALALEPRERDEVAETLWQSIVPEELSPEQVAEVRRRIGALNRGELLPIPGAQVMQELRQRFQR